MPKEHLLALRKELAMVLLRSRVRLTITSVISIIVASIHCVFNGAQGSLNGKPTPILDFLITWGAQFPIVSLIVFVVLFTLQWMFTVEIFRSSLNKLPDSFFGVVTLSLFDDRLTIKTQKGVVTLEYFDISNIIETSHAIHLMGESKLCYASVPKSTNYGVVVDFWHRNKLIEQAVPSDR